MSHNVWKNEQGMFFPTAVLLFMLLFWMATISSVFVLNSVRTARRLAYTSRAHMAVDAGTELAIQGVNEDPDTFTGSGGEITFYTEPSGKYRTTYTTTVSADPLITWEKTIESIGRVYVPASSNESLLAYQTRVNLSAGSVNFEHTVQSGSGPLYLYGNAGIGGSIYSNNFIHMEDNAAQIGGQIFVANKNSSNCPIADSGSAVNSTIRIDPGVLLPNSATCNVTTTGSTIDNSTDIPERPLPDAPEDELAEISAYERCSLLNSPSGSQPYPMPSAHYTTDGTAMGTNCNVTLENSRSYSISGNIHIKGDLTGTNNSISTSGSDDIFIFVDGKITLSRVTVVGSAPIIFVSTSDCDARYVACDPDQGLEETVNPSNYLTRIKNNPNAIEISGNNLNMNAYFLAPNGSIGFGGSTSASGTIGAMAAQTIVMKGSGASTFLNIYPTSLGNQVWAVKEYQRIYD